MSARQITAAPAAAPLNAATTGGQIFAVQGQPSVPAAVNLPGTGRLGGKKFTVRASGTVTTNAAGTTFAPAITVGVPTLSGTTAILGAPAAVAVANTSVPWFIEASLVYDTVLGKLLGVFTALVGSTYSAAATVTSPAAALSNTGEPVAQFAAGGVFSAASSGNIITLAELVIET